ncbi:hypothetical protein BDW74DRAFT_183600 [Aspergillus multicolor]|uniref:uncharacterized protein n=1 Tax=Aspergillus multicolor TaxID=41759 RepID=UPI003CCDDBED
MVASGDVVQFHKLNQALEVQSSPVSLLTEEKNIPLVWSYLRYIIIELQDAALPPPRLELSDPKFDEFDEFDEIPGIYTMEKEVVSIVERSKAQEEQNTAARAPESESESEPKAVVQADYDALIEALDCERHKARLAKADRPETDVDYGQGLFELTSEFEESLDFVGDDSEEDI